jgi:antitoxin component YwqK of YwqJK toxin-antitoxin module
MKIIFLSFSILILFLFFCSCSNNFDGKNGTETIFFTNSKIIHKTIEFKDGKRNGLLKEFFPSGHLHKRAFYVNDELKDSTVAFFDNGMLESVTIVINKKKEGCWLRYNEAGKLVSSTCYHGGILDGCSITYTYTSSRLFKKLNFANGKKEGRQEEYYNNGNIKSVTYFHEDKPCMGTEEYYELGGKINNDFKITITEQNQVLIDGLLRYIIRLENIQPDDDVCQVGFMDTGRELFPMLNLIREKDYFVMDFKIGKGQFVMEKIRLAAYRHTKKGNVYIKTTTFNVSTNNF